MSRLVVTETGPDQRSVARVNELPRVHGTSSTVLWATDSNPASWEAPADDEAWSRLGTPPPVGGSKLVHLTLAPNSKGVLHQTDSVDYAVVVRGAVIAKLETMSVTLSAGDVLVQRGTVHAWSNPGAEPAELIITLLDALPRRANSLKQGERPSARR